MKKLSREEILLRRIKRMHRQSKADWEKFDQSMRQINKRLKRLERRAVARNQRLAKLGRKKEVAR